MDTVKLEFCDFQSLRHLPEAESGAMDKLWVAIGNMKDSEHEYRFRNLAHVMIGILTIPHSNASCERVFSIVRKNKTDQRASLGRETLDALLVVKSEPGSAYRRDYSAEKLKTLKSALYRQLNDKDND